MHGSFDRSGKSESFSDRWRIGFFVFPVVLAVALIALAILEPASSKWISEQPRLNLPASTHSRIPVRRNSRGGYGNPDRQSLLTRTGFEPPTF